MKSKPSSDREPPAPGRVWTLSEARAAAPYLASIVRSIREYALEIRAQRRLFKRLSDKPGRPTRVDLIDLQEADRAARHAEEHLREASSELEALDIHSLDAAQGTAIVPFVQDGQLAWYIFDLFDERPFRSWRFHTDPDSTRRHLTALRQS
jgi:hypothetical protein